MTYSIDFRKKVLLVKEREKLTFEEVAERFDIGIASVVRWSRKIEPQRKRNKPATKIDMVALAQDVEKEPNAYQYERAKRFGVSRRGIGEALKRLKMSNKKNAKPSTSRCKRVKE